MICIEKMISDRFEWCMTYEPEKECRGASGRKLRQDCIWCPCYDKYRKRKKEEENVEEDN